MKALRQARIGMGTAVTALAAACAPEAVDLQDSEGEHGKDALASSFVVMAGTTGPITTLSTYGNGTAHPGTNAFDIDDGESSVYFQLGELGAGVAGGWIHIGIEQSPGYCSEFSPGSPYYNGSKIVVTSYLYDRYGEYLGHHRAAYQHVIPYDPHMNLWWTWNNAAGDAAAWPVPDHILGNGAAGGVYLGEIFTSSQTSIYYEGNPAILCWQGSHLHQEGAGERAINSYSNVSSRTTPLHRFDPAGGFGGPGAPPSVPAPGSQPGDPGDPGDPAPPDPGEPAPPSDGCGGIGYEGVCDAAVLTWCEAGALRSADCTQWSLSCGYQDSSVGNNCVSGCGSLDYLGGCSGSSLRWCEGGSLRVYECANAGKVCGWQDGAVGYNCL